MGFLTKLFYSLSSINIFADDEGNPNNGNSWFIFVLLGVLVIVMVVVLPMMRRKKQTQYVSSMHNGLKVGCTVKTLGGIVGKVVAVNELNPVDKEVVIETGADGQKSTLTFDINYMYAILTNADGSRYVMPSMSARGPRSATTASSMVQEHTSPQPFEDSVQIEQKEGIKDNDSQHFEQKEGIKDNNIPH